VLSLMGLDELVAQDSETYVRIAVALSHDQSRIRGYRNELRGRFENSPLRDEKGFVLQMEDVIHRIANR